MKPIFFSIIILTISFNGNSQTSDCFPDVKASTFTTTVIKRDTTITCASTSHFVICPGVKATFNDNSCSNNFYLENNATLILDSNLSYGYSKIWVKNTATLDANYKQFLELHQATASNLIDTNSHTGSPGSYMYVCSTMAFDYTNMPGGVSGCSNIVGIEKITLNEITLEVYPNPAQTYVTVEIPVRCRGSLNKLILTDGSGRILHQQTIMENTVVDLNIDMIGRIDKAHEIDSNYVYLIGADKLSTQLHQVSDSINTKYTNINLDYKYNDENDPNRFYYRSDHYNFAKNNIPIIFYFNGTHADYHKPGDTPDKINYDLLENRTRLVFHTAWEIANKDKRLVVDKAGE